MIFWFAIIVVIVLLVRSCGNRFGGIFGGKTDTVRVVSDTVVYYTVTDTAYIPQVTKITNTIYKPVYRTDTLEITEVLPTDTRL